MRTQPRDLALSHSESALTKASPLEEFLRTRLRLCARAGLRWLLCGLLCVTGAAAQATPASDNRVLVQSQLNAAGVVYGIIRYTKWPQPHDPLRLCISDRAPDAGDMKTQLPDTVHGRALAVVLIEEGVKQIEGCDVLYLDGWPADSIRDSLRAATGRPVLTVGRGAEFCTDGGMFCLQPRAGATGFETNLNAVSLSGLRVHPQVLRLARPPHKEAS